MKGKKGQIFDTLLPWIIGIAVLVVLIGFYLMFSGKGLAAIEYIKNLFRFGR